MLRLFNYLKGSAKVCAILAPLFMLLEVAMDLMQPTLLANIINIGVANADLTYVIKTGLLMLGAVLLGLVGGAGCSIFAAIAAMHLGESIRESVFSKIQRLSFLDIDYFKAPSLITRVTNDITQIQQMVLLGLKLAIRAPLTCIGGIIMAYLLSPKLSIVFVIVIPIIIVIVCIVSYYSFPMFRKMQEKIDRVNNVMRENLLGIRVIKAFTMENKRRHKFKDANEDLMQTSMKAQNITMVLMPIVMFLVNMSVIAVLWYGGVLTSRGELATGNIMAFVNYLVQIMASVMMVVMVVINFSRAKASADRIGEVLDKETSIVDTQQPEKVEGWSVEFKNVSFKYFEKSEYVLENISFKAEAGQKIGIIGGTGSGKSSLVGLIPRLYDVTEGEVLIGGKNVKSLSLGDLRDQIGVVLQESILFSGTIEDNIQFGKDNATKEEIESATQTAQAYEFIMNKPKGYEDLVEQRGKNLSGGQKQRVSIARTLIKKPHILILDDSSSALDMATERKLQKAIKERLGETTCFMIAQRISAIKDSDQIIVLDEGKISGIGTHEELIKENEIYRSIAISQLGEEEVGYGES